MYHYVRPLKNSEYPEIKGLEVGQFQNQIEFFRKNFHFGDVNILFDSIESSSIENNDLVFLTFDDGLMTIYLNGENVKSCDGMPNSDDNDYSLAIGAAIRDLTYNEYFNGKIYSASIWAETLSQEQLQEYIINEAVPNENLVSRYTFDSGFGDILYDHSGNQNHGTIYGADWVENLILGDINEDFELNIQDIIMMIDLILEPGDTYDSRADMNQDENLNIQDIILILDIILGN